MKPITRLVVRIFGLATAGLLMSGLARAQITFTPPPGPPPLVFSGGVITPSPLSYSYDGSVNASSPGASYCPTVNAPIFPGPGGAFPGPPGFFAGSCGGAVAVTGTGALSGTAPTAGTITETITVAPADYSQLLMLAGLYQPVYVSRVWSAGGTDIFTYQWFQLAQPIAANADVGSVPAGGGTVNVIANDTIGAAPASPANAVVLIISGGGLAGLTVDPALNIVVPTAQPPGSYAVQYSLCDALSAGANCVTATATVTVIGGVVVAGADAATFAYGVGGTVSILANDTVNAAAATSANATGSITANGGLTGVSLNGILQMVVPTTALPGIYGVTYQICNIAMPASCASAVATITISAPTVAAAADAATIAFGGGNVNVLANDSFQAGVATTTNVAVTITNAAGMTGLTVNGAGAIVVPAGTNAPAAYPVVYQICAIVSPAVCSSATATITISAPVITATTDPSQTIPLGGGTVTVITNDLIGGIPATPANSLVTITAPGGLAGLTVNGSRAIVVPASPSGIYTVTYQICAVLAPAACASTTAVINVASVALSLVVGADNFTFTAQGGNGNVFGNDVVGGVTASAVNAIVSIVSNGGLTTLSINSAGVLALGATPPGIYSVTYRVCQATLITNCANGTITITVTSIAAAVNDTANVQVTGGSISVLANDTVLGSPASASNSTVTITNAGGLTGLTVNSAMQIVVPPNLAIGNYTLTYQLCPTATPAFCVTANVALTIAAPAIVATADTLAVPDTGGILNVLANDTVGGQPATAANATVSLISAGGINGLTVNANRAIVVPAGSLAGSYALVYRVCSIVAPSACANANVALTVSATARTLVLQDDRVTVSVTGGNINVLTNDTANGIAIVPAQFVLSLVDSGGLNGLMLAANGVATIPPVSAGAYTATYRACQASLSSNCANARIFINVSQTAVPGGSTTTTRRPPSVPGPAGVFTAPTIPGVSTLLFTPAIPTTAGQVGATLLLGETKLGYGLHSAGTNFKSYRVDQDSEPFGAELRYTGSGVITYRWEVMQPGDPEPSDFDLVPAPALSLDDQLRQTTYNLIERNDIYLPLFGRFFLRGPDPSKLPRDVDGTYRILLRIEADTTSTGGPASGASPFPIRPITYVIQPASRREREAAEAIRAANPDNVVAGASRNRDRFQARTGVAEFSSVGQVPDGGNVLEGGSLKPRPVGQPYPTLSPGKVSVMGANLQSDGNMELQWNEFKDAGSYRITIDTGNTLTAQTYVGVVRSGTTVLKLALTQLPAAGTLRWRVEAYSAEGKVVGQSDWQVLKR